jgi:hypothetical protein
MEQLKLIKWSFTMFKATPNPPETDADSQASLDAEKMKEAADRAFSHYFPPLHEKPAKRRKSQLFTVAPISTPKPFWPMPPKTCCPSAPLLPIWRTMWKAHAAL